MTLITPSFIIEKELDPSAFDPHNVQNSYLNVQDMSGNVQSSPMNVIIFSLNVQNSYRTCLGHSNNYFGH